MPYSMAGEELPSKIRRVLEDEDSSGSNLGIEVLLANTSVDAANQDQHEIFGADTINTLPEGWVVVRHESGGNVYLHKQSRVCTWSKPYTVSSSKTIKKHKVPLGSIPCLEQILHESEDQSLLGKKWRQELFMKELHSNFKLDSNRLSEYIKQKWPHGVPIPYESNKEDKPRRKKPNASKTSDQIVVVPEAVSKVITVNVPKQYIKPDADGKKNPPIWVVNVNQKLPVSILLEFCQKYLRNEVNYIMEETSNHQSPYYSTAVIGGVHYGNGSGPSKRSARQLAAEATLDLFLPGIFKDILSNDVISNEKLEYISTISIDDPHSASLLSQAGLPSPWQTLRECFQRLKGHGVGEPTFSAELQPSSSRGTAADVKMNYKLSCGPKYEVTGICTGRKDGQQLAAQKMLQLLHPHLHSWDSLFKLYADSHSKLPKLIKDQQCVNLTRDTNNEELLKCLHQEMRKLADH